MLLYLVNIYDICVCKNKGIIGFVKMIIIRKCESVGV